MCCFESKRNEINIDAAHERIEVREGRWLRVIYKDIADSSVLPDTVLPSISASSSKTILNSWISSGIGNKALSRESRTERTNKIVVFFIHGVGGCADVWQRQIEHFSKLGYVIVAPDILGHGGSSAPRDPSFYNFSELSCDMFAVFDRYRSEKKNILVGHSYGCSFCTMIASKRPRQVSKMVLVSGGGPVPLHPQPCHLFCLPSCILACLKPFVVWTFRRMGFYTHTSQDTVQFLDAFKVPSYVLRATMMGQNWNEGDEEFHSDLMVATLLIHGSHDKFVSLEEEAYMHETIYGSKLEVLEDTGHMVMLECPDKVNELIFHFLHQDASTHSESVISQGNHLPATSSIITTNIKNSASALYDVEVDLHK